MFYEPEKEKLQTSHKLPHWQQKQVWTFVTYRLADSLPKHLLSELKEHREAWLHHNPKPWNERQEEEFHRFFGSKVDEWLDAGHGCCCLRDPENSSIVANAFRHFDEKRYLIDSFIVMPNHVHILFSLFENESISQVIHSWKRFSAREINKRNKTTGSLWQPEYWDRLIRNHDHFLWARSYIERNPKKLPPKTYNLYQRP